VSTCIYEETDEHGDTFRINSQRGDGPHLIDVQPRDKGPYRAYVSLDKLMQALVDAGVEVPEPTPEPWTGRYYSNAVDHWVHEVMSEPDIAAQIVVKRYSPNALEGIYQLHSVVEAKRVDGSMRDAYPGDYKRVERPSWLSK